MSLWRDGAEILGFIDVKALGAGVIAKALRPRSGHHGIAVAIEATGRRAEFRGVKEVKSGQSRTQGGELGEHVLIRRERNAREVGAQELGVRGAIGWGIQDGVDVVEDILGRGRSAMRCRQGRDQFGTQIGLPCGRFKSCK